MGREDLYITVPSFFRCPISLDVMKSPVSLCTGVTYDRSSIQRWLDGGNNTCPATMQVLPSTDFIPNHTLHRLIQLWSSSAKPGPEPEPVLHSLSFPQALHLINLLLTSDNSNNFECLIKLLCFASESPENRKFLASNEAFVDLLLRVVASGLNPDPDFLEAGLKILQIISPKLTAVTIVKNYPGFLSSLAQILKTGRSDSRLAVSGILQTIASDPESKRVIFDDDNNLLSQIIQILRSYSEGSNQVSAAETAVAGALLSSLVFLSTTRSNKQKLVRADVVRIMAGIIRGAESDSAVTELAITQLEMLAGSAEGRAAIGEDPNCVAAVVQKLMRASRAGKEHGVALLWSLCYLFRDQRAKEAVVRSNGGLTKILLLMQSDCSPAVKRMCSDLLRIFRVNFKSCLPSYDSKTAHIMPC